MEGTSGLMILLHRSAPCRALRLLWAEVGLPPGQRPLPTWIWACADLLCHFWSDKLVVSTSCSLLHTAVDLANEPQLDDEVKSWLAFAAQKLAEVNALARALVGQKDEVHIHHSSVHLCQEKSTSTRPHGLHCFPDLAILCSQCRRPGVEEGISSSDRRGSPEGCQYSSC